MSDQNQNDNHKKEIDELSGIETTGHEWDGLKELNNPLPRWWVWVFLITIVWSVWYFYDYPSWPTLDGATKGASGYTQYKDLAQSQAEIQKRQDVYLDRFENASFQEILDDPQLYAFAMAGGNAAFKDNCATCHGSGAQGANGYPALIDDDWLWGGTLDEIHQTIEYGIRVEGNYDSRQGDMMAFGTDELLSREEINAVVDYTLALSGGKRTSTYSQGQTIFMEQCAACHGEDGKGSHDFGAPNLTDKIWLYGGDRQAVYETVFAGRKGNMPAWGERLDENTIRQLTVYLHQLGGGEEDEPVIEEEEMMMPQILPQEEPVTTEE